MKQFLGVPAGLCRQVGGSVACRLLAERIGGVAGDRFAELGSGCGEIAVRVALANPGVLVDGLELQETLNQAAGALATRHGVDDRVRIITGDVRNPPVCMVPGSYAQLFCNPPFFSPAHGRIPANSVRAAARFELTAGLLDFFKCGFRLLADNGIFHLVHRPERLVEILTGLQASGLTPVDLVPVHAYRRTPAVLVLISARNGGGAGGFTLSAAELIEDV